MAFILKLSQVLCILVLWLFSPGECGFGNGKKRVTRLHTLWASGAALVLEVAPCIKAGS